MNGTSLRCLAANRLWAETCRPAGRRFRAALRDPAGAQWHHLSALLRRNAATEFGRQHGFDAIRSVDDFRRRVPLSRYEDYAHAVAAIAAGRPRVLTRDRVRLFEPTSGSAAAAKFIPYTPALRREFGAGIAPWVQALFLRHPGVLRGRAYWSVTPHVPRPDRLGAIPVGFDEDSGYLGWLAGRLFRAVGSVPRDVAAEADTDVFLRRTLAHLLREDNLRLVSVWSPQFLLLLLRRLLEAPGEAVADAAGSGHPGAAARAREVRRALDGAPSGIFPRLWPRLEVVSCWTHGAAAPAAAELASLLPGVALQGKGLIATEAFVSLPFAAGSDPVLAVTSHFFEFRERESGDLATAETVAKGRCYSVVVTTGGGLYRYELGDVVEVTGFVGGAPALRFLGRERTSDRCGEKLAAAYVDAGVAALLQSRGTPVGFVLLAPDDRPDGTLGYTLFLQSDGAVRRDLLALEHELESLLRRTFHYDYCRRLGQLETARVFRITNRPAGALRIYSDHGVRRGLRLGDVKPAILTAEGGWRGRFAGDYADSPEQKES